MATIRDVAKKANVSTATVSRVINNHPSVTLETRELVHQAMDELSYLPSRSTIKLSGKKSGLLGALVPNLSNPHFNELVSTLEQEARYYGMNLIVKTHQNEAEMQKAAIKSFISLGAEALFWVPTEGESELVELVRRGGLETVVVTQRSKFFDSILVDSRKGAALAAQHFFELGFSNIGFIGQKSVDNEKLSVFTQCLAQRGLNINHNSIIWIDKGTGENVTDYGQGAAQAAEEICNQPQEHTALWIYNDVFAVRLVKELIERGKKIPQDVSLISFDDTYLAHLMNITSITQPIREIARLAYCHIRDRERDESIECIELEPRIVTRQSTLQLKVTTIPLKNKK